jgi:prohibitin 1
MLRMMRAVTFGAVGIGAVTYTCCFVVRPGESAVLYNRLTGIRDVVLEEGLRFRVLGLEEPKLFNVRTQPRELTTTTGTKDLQVVDVKLRVLFHPDTQQLAHIYRSFGTDYDERVLPSVSNEVLKAVIAEYKAEELIVKREQVSKRLATLMREKLSAFNIIVDDISLMHIQFSAEFMAAVEQKQVAQQEAERFKFVVMENEQKKLAAIVRAEGEAHAAKLISDAMAKSGPGLVELRRIEAARVIAENLADSPHVKFTPPGTNVLLNMSGGGYQQQQRA